MVTDVASAGGEIDKTVKTKRRRLPGYQRVRVMSDTILVPDLNLNRKTEANKV